MTNISNPDPKYILQLIAEGYLDEIFYNHENMPFDRYVRVVNPKYRPDDGSDPYIVYDIYEGEGEED